MQNYLTLKIVLSACTAYVVYTWVEGLRISWRNSRRARELHCEEPPRQHAKYPFGIDNLQSALAADKVLQFPVYVAERSRDIGALTHKYSIMGSTSIFTADEKNIQAILATQFRDFDLGPDRRGNFFPLLGNGIFTEDGAPWEHSRALIRPQFSRDQVSDLELEEVHVQNLLRALPVSSRDGNWTEPVDLQVLFFRLTLDSASEFLFGESVDSQLHALPSYQKPIGNDNNLSDINFAKYFDAAQGGISFRGRFGKKYWMINPNGFKNSCKQCHDFIDHFVRLALSNRLDDKNGEGKDDSRIKGRYVFLDAIAAQTQDPTELRTQLLNILLAGRDTTASLLGWTFFCLARDPIRFQKLRNVILNEFGTLDNPLEITFAKLKSCRYLQFVNNEVLRLYPVVPINNRYANKDTTLPRGGGKDGKSRIFVPKGTSCDYSVYVMHHRADIWGPDVEEFNPERWENRKVGWEYLPFNGGPRICIGQQFALTEASYVTVRLLQQFDNIENLDFDPIVRHNLTLTDCSGNGVKVRLHAA